MSIGQETRQNNFPATAPNNSTAFEWRVNKNGSIKACLHNVKKIFLESSEFQGLFCHNDFSLDIEFTRTPFWDSSKAKGNIVTDNDLVRIKAYCSAQHEFEPRVDLIQEAIVDVAFNKRIHPIREYLNSLKWDGTPRLDTFLIKCAGAEDNPYTRAVTGKVIIAAVARIMSPGCKFDQLLVMEGDQGIGKSTLIRILAGPWYAPLIITEKGKDLVEVMRGKWILEVEEMAGFNKNDIEHIKAFLSRQTDRFRLAYRRNSEDSPRQSIVIGTINPDGDNKYLRDMTGNRRFWPIACSKKIDFELVRNIRDQLFAEAVIRYNAGEALYLSDPDVLEIAFRNQRARSHAEEYVELIKVFLGQYSGNRITATEILTQCLNMNKDKINSGYTGRVGRAMKVLGWKRDDDQDTNITYYIRPQIKQEEIQWEALVSEGVEGEHS